MADGGHPEVIFFDNEDIQYSMFIMHERFPLILTRTKSTFSGRRAYQFMR